MRIAIVTDYHNKTGIGKQNYQLYRAFRELGHEAEIIHLVSKQGFREPPEFGTNIVSTYFLKGVFHDFRTGLAEHLTQNRYDVVLLGHQWLAYLYDTLERSKIPFALTIFDLFALYSEYVSWWDPRFFVFNRFLLGPAKKFRNVVFSSKFTERDFERFYGAKPPNSAVISIGIPTHTQNVPNGSSARDWKDFFSGKRVVLQVGSSDKRKNARVFFSIAEDFSHDSDFSDMVFVRVGKTPEEWKTNAPKNMAFFQNLSEADLVALYDSASVFVFTSWHEGYGMPVVEARAVGLPVVSTVISDMAELFAEDPGALFVHDANDVAEYGAHIRKILSIGGKIPSPVIEKLNTSGEARKYVSFFKKTTGIFALK